MKLHVKLSLALVTGLVVVVVIAQIAQYQAAVGLISDLSRSHIEAVREREEAFVRSIFDSVDRSVAESLQRGEMEKFAKVINSRKNVSGLLELSLYDRTGIVSHSTDPARVKRPLPDDLRTRLLSRPEVFVRYAGKAIEVFRPLPVTDECVRCHKDWTVGSIGGVTGVRFSTAPLEAARKQSEETLTKARRTFLILCLLTLAGIVVFFMVTMYASVARVIRKPIARITGGLKDLSRGEGDLTRRLEVDSTNELGALATHFNTFIEKLQDMVAQVQKSGIQVTSSATELAAAAREQEVTLRAQTESTSRVLGSVEEISTVASELEKTMRRVADMSQDAASLATSGQRDLSGMGDAMRGMESASQSISSRLEAINEKAENITTVVTTIAKVADQTNLLSLNAAIEAEKAGEYGRGFMVVAREIRRLADQTALATLDIDQMVKEMHSAVSAGVMEMEKFVSRVRHSAEDVGRIGSQLSLIIEQVQALTPTFEDVNLAMGRHSETARHIESSVSGLNEEMLQTIESLRESFRAIEQLNDAAQGLHEQVSRFKVKH